MSTVDLKELRKIVRFCQKNGIISYKSGDFAIELSKFQPSVKQEISDSEIESFPSWDSLTPEQKLLWSATPDGLSG